MQYTWNSQMLQNHGRKIFHIQFSGSVHSLDGGPDDLNAAFSILLVLGNDEASHIPNLIGKGLALFEA